MPLKILVTSFLAILLGPIAVTGVSDKAPTDRFTSYQLKHWAFQQRQAYSVPAVRDSALVRNPVDAFVLARLEAKNVTPSPRARKTTLIRRAYLDLIGLPPSAEQVKAFVSDRSADAFERVVDELLASRHYGERWARHWLDLARYADSEGFKSDQTRPNAWRYRDYVIESLNSDKPYDRFIREQIAGDEIWPNDLEAFVATGFNRHYPDEDNARNLMQRRQEILHDITTTVGSVFMGLTYGCARCHDHKFDPILQSDYYRLQAFFANVRAEDGFVLLPEKAAEKRQQRWAQWNEKTAGIRQEMRAIEEPARKKLTDEFVEKYPAEIRDAILTSPEQRSPYQRLMYYKVKPFLDPDSHISRASIKAVVKGLKEDEKKRWKELKSNLDQYADLHPGEVPVGIGMTDGGRRAPKTYILSGGAYDAPQQEVLPGFLSMLDPGPATIIAPERIESTGRRTALADWLAAPENPLTARVIVNRLWHYHFGRGIVGTTSNFGLSGDLPSHPELLDWLATRLISSGWSLKEMHRIVMNSSTYQQSSRHRTSAATADPENKLLWRFPRRRLEGEIIRDAALAVSGLLNPKMGGPSVFPPLPPGMVTRGGWKVTSDPVERRRRSIYVFVRRNTRYPMFETFDMPDTHESCPRRSSTTSPLQSLFLLNSELVLEWAQGFAARVLFSAGPERDAQIETAYRLAYSRGPDDGERDTAHDFFARHTGIIADQLAAGHELVLPTMRPYGFDPVDAAVLVDFCHMMLNSSEFVYLN